MSSAESSPLFNTPVSCARDIPLSSVRSDPSRSAVNPLAAVSLMLGTAELDRLAIRAGAASERYSMRSQTKPQAPCRERFPNHAVPPNTPALRSVMSSESVTECTSTILTTETQTSASASQPSVLLLNTSDAGVDASSDDIGATLHALRKHYRRKASSRIPEIFATEGIPEVSDEEDWFPSSSTSALGPTPSALDSGTNGLHSLGNPANSTQSAPIPGAVLDPVDKAFEKARLTEDLPPKTFPDKAVTTWRRIKTIGLRVEFTTPLNECVEPEASKITAQQNHEPESQLRPKPPSSYLSLSEEGPERYSGLS